MPAFSSEDRFAALEMRRLLDQEGIYPTLRAVRLSLGYTQPELAAELGIAFSTLSSYERGAAAVPERVRERLWDFCGSWIAPGFQPPADGVPEDVRRAWLGTLVLAATAKAEGRPIPLRDCIRAAARFDRYGWPWDQRREIAS